MRFAVTVAPVFSEDRGSAADTMLASVLGQAPSIAAMMGDLIEPIIREREAIRDHLLLSGHLSATPSYAPTTPLICTDGALTSSPLSIGDHYATLSVAVESTKGRLNLRDHKAWSTFVPHSPSSDKLASAVMLTHELALAATAPDTALVVLDGSHATAITTIADLLANTDKTTVRRYLDVVTQKDVYDWIVAVMTSNHIVAQQKHDSSTHLWDALTAAGLHLTGTGLPDKPLASLILEPGEALTHPSCAPAWETTAAHLSTAASGTLRGALRDLLEPLVVGRSIRVSHVKPPHAQLALRVEHKADLAGQALAACFASLAHDTVAPHVQEPVVQYMADKMAKNVASASTIQLESARIEAGLGGHADLLPYVLHYYRT